MSGTKHNPDNNGFSPHGWSLDTLEEFLTAKIGGVEKYFTELSNEREARTSERFASSKEAVTSALAAAEKAIAAAMTASEKAILKAEAAAEKRSEASNEIRAAMIDQQKNFADKSQTEFRFGSLDQRIEENNKSLSKRLDTIDNTLSMALGKSQMLSSSGTALFMAIVAGAAIGGFIVNFLHR
jgi:hypothetical protein